jgi:hypothetical protein
MGILSGNEILFVLFIGDGGKTFGADRIDGPIRPDSVSVLRCLFHCVLPPGLSLKRSTHSVP